MKIMEAWQKERVRIEKNVIRNAKTLDELVEIGVQIFSSHQDWYKDGCRGEYVSKMNSLRTSEPSEVFIVDAHNWIYADWNMSKDANGAVDMFFSRVKKYSERHKPSVLFAAFESETSFRKELEPLYKSKRTETDPDLLRQRDEIRSRCFEEGILAYSVEGYEADDVIASIAFRANLRGENAVIASNDRHARQLINRKTRLWHKDEFTTEIILKESDMGIKPNQVPDWICLVGKDDVPGAANIGPKTATLLLNHYPDFISMTTAPIDKESGLTEKNKASILEFEPRYATCHRIHSLVRHLDIRIDWDTILRQRA